MKGYHCCATCVHYEIRKDTIEKYFCSRLGYATSPKHQFKCWTPKDNIRKKIKNDEHNV